MSVRVLHLRVAGLWTMSGPGLLRQWRGGAAGVVREQWGGGVASSARGWRLPSASYVARETASPDLDRRSCYSRNYRHVPRCQFIASQPFSSIATLAYCQNCPEPGTLGENSTVQARDGNFRSLCQNERMCFNTKLQYLQSISPLSLDGRQGVME